MKTIISYMFLFIFPSLCLAAGPKASPKAETIDLQQGKIEAAIADKDEQLEQEMMDLNTRTKIDAVEADTQPIDHKGLKSFALITAVLCQRYPTNECIKLSNQLNREVQISDSRTARNSVTRSRLFQNVKSGVEHVSKNDGTR